MEDVLEPRKPVLRNVLDLNLPENFTEVFRFLLTFGRINVMFCDNSC